MDKLDPIPIDPQDYKARLETASDLELATWLNFVGSPICREAAKRLERAVVLKTLIDAENGR